jgi:integrase
MSAQPKKQPADRPAKPSPDFPLFAHQSGYWAKKVKGKMVYYKKWADDPDGSKSMAVLEKQQKTALRVAQVKPEKPHPDFPLNSHADGSWYRYIPGFDYVKLGSWRDDPKGEKALELFSIERDDWFAGINPRNKATDQIADVLANVLAHKLKEVEAGNLDRISFDELKDVADMLVDYFGHAKSVKAITPTEWSEFKFEKIQMYNARDHKTNTPVLDEAGQPVRKARAATSVTNLSGRVKTLFNIAVELELVAALPRYAGIMKRAKQKEVRRAKNARKGLMFSAPQLHEILDACNPAVKAMSMVAINVGIGNKDISLIKFDNIDFENGMLDYARHKTEVERVVPLWPETIQAIRDYLKVRPDVPELDEYIFITQKTKKLYFRETISKTGRAARQDSMGQEFIKVLKSLGIYKKNLGFYSIRRTFQTIGDETGFESAVKACMAHAECSRDMSATYRQTLAKQKRKVVQHVRKWFLENRKTSPHSSESGSLDETDDETLWEAVGS